MTNLSDFLSPEQIFNLEIMNQLQKSDRFRAFFHMHYDVDVHADEETQTVEVRLRELEVEESLQRMQDMAAELEAEEQKAREAAAAPKSLRDLGMPSGINPPDLLDMTLDPTARALEEKFGKVNE